MKLSLPTILTLIFLVLKLTHTVAWSWIWVFSPIWIPLAIVAAIAGASLLFVLFTAASK